MPGRQDGSVPYSHPDSAAPLVKLRQAWKASYEADPTRCPKCLSPSVKDAPEYDGEGVACWTCGWSLETSATLLLRDKPSSGKTKMGNQHWRTRRTKLEAEVKRQYCIAGKHVLAPDTMEKDWRCGRCVNAANYARWTRNARQRKTIA
jgi:hypothetical protein